METYKGFDGVARTVYTVTINGRKWDYVRYDGSSVRPVHLDSMLAAAFYTPGWGRLRITQGGLSRAVKASAKTHYDLDVVDIATAGKTKAKVWEFCDNLFETGSLPFPRGYVRDGFQNNKHIHSLWWPCSAGHPQLQNQYTEYVKYRGDGLSGSAGYTGPVNPKLYNWSGSMFNPKNRQDGNSTLYVNVAKGETLLGVDRDRVKKTSRKRGDKLDFIARVYRWERWNRLTKYGTFYAENFLTEKEILQ